VPHPAGEQSPAVPEVGLCALAEPVDRSVGDVLTPTIEQVRWLEALPAFAPALANASRQLEEELTTLRRAAESRADVARLPELIAYTRKREDEAARRFDGTLVDEALARTQGYWNWQMEYGTRVRATPRQERSSCPFCGAFASDVDYADWANPRIRRTSKTCGYCGIVADLPVWDLRVRIVPETVAFSATAVSGRAEGSNEGDRSRRVTLGVGVERGGAMQPKSIAKTEVVVTPGDTASFVFNLTPVKPMRELYQLRLYAASEGAFGLVTAFVLFGRAPS